MSLAIRLLRPADLEDAARLYGACEDSGRGEQEALEWLRELSDGPELVALVARDGGELAGIAIASSAAWSSSGPTRGWELCVRPSCPEVGARLDEALELVLWAEGSRRHAA
ncbi:MAG: hypothetical protein ACXVZO_00095 [Gaiellaceae bacterium]